MPRTNRGIDRETKIERILAGAERKVLEAGYDGMSVVGIARELGIAQNSIYWYFPSKDDLFLAAVGRIAQRIMGAPPPTRSGVRERILWSMDRLDELEPVRATVTERARQSEKVAAFDRAVADGLRAALSDALRSHVPPEQHDDVVDAFFAVADGVLRQRLPSAERRRVLSFALEQLAGIGEGTAQPSATPNSTPT